MLKYSLSLTIILLTIENIAGFYHLEKTKHIPDSVSGNEPSVPFIANVHQDNQRLCEGAIIHKRFIATTITCCHRMDLATVRIRVGSLDDQKGDDYEVCNYVQDPYYNPIIKTNDLCLIKLNKDLKWSDKVKPAQIPTRPLEPKKKGEIFSWTEFHEKHNLTIDPAYVIDKNQCNSHPTEYQICVGDEAGHKPCGSVHGSPFILDRKWLYGLGSAYLNCDPLDETKSMIFTDIYAYKDFIHTVIGNTTRRNMC